VLSDRDYSALLLVGKCPPWLALDTKPISSSAEQLNLTAYLRKNIQTDL